MLAGCMPHTNRARTLGNNQLEAVSFLAAPHEHPSDHIMNAHTHRILLSTHCTDTAATCGCCCLDSDSGLIANIRQS